MAFSGGNRRRRSIAGSLPGSSPSLPPPTSQRQNNSRSRHQYSRSQQLPSTSLPFGNPFASRGDHHYSLSLGSNNSSSTNSSNGSSEPLTPATLTSPRPYPTSNSLSIEFDGDTQMVILRPNRIIRGMKEEDTLLFLYIKKYQQLKRIKKN